MRLPDSKRSYAVLIGTGTYHSDLLPDLPAVANNLRELNAVLTDPALGGLAPERCVVVPDPGDPRTLFRTLRRYASAAEDTFLVYFAGHGQTGPRNELYLGLAETDPDELKVSALAFDLLRDVLADCPASNRVVILDCCFSGRAIQDMAGEEETILGQVAIEGTYVLAATPVNAVALAPVGSTHTAFTGELLSLLRSGIPSGPEFLTHGEIYRQLLHTATARGLPLPRRRGTGTADLLALSRNPAVRGRAAAAVTASTGGPPVPQPSPPTPSPDGEVRDGAPRLLRVAGWLFLLAMFLFTLPALAAPVNGVADITVSAFNLTVAMATCQLCTLRGRAIWSGAAIMLVYGIEVAGYFPWRLTVLSLNQGHPEYVAWEQEAWVVSCSLLVVALGSVVFAIVRMRPPLRLRSPAQSWPPLAMSALALALGLYVPVIRWSTVESWSQPFMWVVSGLLHALVPIAALLVRPVAVAWGLAAGWLAVLLVGEISFWGFRSPGGDAEHLWLSAVGAALLVALSVHLNRSSEAAE